MILRCNTCLCWQEVTDSPRPKGKCHLKPPGMVFTLATNIVHGGLQSGLASCYPVTDGELDGCLEHRDKFAGEMTREVGGVKWPPLATDEQIQQERDAARGDES